MEINIKNNIEYAFYGNDVHTINILNIIKEAQSNKEELIEINDLNFNYTHSNSHDKFLIIKNNNSVFCLNKGDTLKLDYELFENNLKIIIVRTDRDLYWDNWYKNILSLYPNNKIYVIYNFKLRENEELPEKIKIIDNEYYNKGIYLGYYYIIKNKIKGNILVLDDKIILNSLIDESNINRSLFTFEHKWKIDQKFITELLNVLDNNQELILELDKKNWLGSFKSLSYVNSKFLEKLNKKFNILNLIKVINNNQYEMAFERILGILLHSYEGNNEPIFGDIHQELIKNINPWDYSYDKYLTSEKDKYFNYIFR
jgi:hypothetical protein